jgi:hypothetical protein
MSLLVALLVLTIAITAALRRPGSSRKIAVLWGSMPLIVANLVSLSVPSMMILRTADGQTISRTEQLISGFVWGLLSSLVVPLIVSLIVKKKVPIHSPETTRGKLL